MIFIETKQLQEIAKKAPQEIAKPQNSVEEEVGMNIDDIEDIARFMYAWVWNELVNHYNVPIHLADEIADSLEDLVREALEDVGDRGTHR